MSERISTERLDELIVLAVNADGMWQDESSRTALAGWRELKALREVEAAAREVLKWYQPFFEWTQKDPECFCSSELICDFSNLEAALGSLREGG